MRTRVSFVGMCWAKDFLRCFGVAKKSEKYEFFALFASI